MAPAKKTTKDKAKVEETEERGQLPETIGTQSSTVQLLARTGGPFENLINADRFNQLWRVAVAFSKSKNLVPMHYQGQPEDCFVATQMAMRLQVDPLMLMQNTYVVKGKPGMQAQLATALVNTSGLFVDPIDYEIEGDDPFDKKAYRVRAFATRKSTGKKLCGPWIDWRMVEAEGWSKREGSKWLTIPGQMFLYRAATFFARVHCPERLMGMHTIDELEDTEPRKRVDAHEVSGNARVKAKLVEPASVSDSQADELKAADGPGGWLCKTGHQFTDPKPKEETQFGLCPECLTSNIQPLQKEAAH